MKAQRPPNLRRTTSLILLTSLALLTIIIWHQSQPNPISQPQHQTQTPDLSSASSPSITWPLHRLCKEQTQIQTIPGLIFLCDNNSGGPGNIRNYILTCIRYAISSGATGLQIPRIRARSTDAKSDLFAAYQPFSYMFSESHFRTFLSTACPHITIYPDTGNLSADIPFLAAKSQRENLPPERMIRQITPKDHGGSRAGCDVRDPHRYTDLFGPAFRSSLEARAVELRLPPTSPENPMLLRLSWGVLWDWPVHRDGPEMAATFGGLLRIRDDILELADGVVRAMRELAAVRDGRDASSLSSSPSGHGIFLGVHLRTEEDALSQWPTYGNQSHGYLKKAEEMGFRGGVAYLASGSEKEARRFAKDAQAHLQLNVKSKYDLVHGGELEKLNSLSWDQQALVDFAVLLGSDYFVGVSPSSFSINVALKRHLQKEGLYTRPWNIGSSDGRSWLVGRYDKYWDDWLFMFDGMWP